MAWGTLRTAVTGMQIRKTEGINNDDNNNNNNNNNSDSNNK